MVDAIPALTTDKAVALFERFHVFTRAELLSRAEIQYETYAKAINIEAKAMIDIASKQIIPAVVRYTKTLADTVNSLMTAGASANVQLELLKETTALLEETKAALAALEKLDGNSAEVPEGEELAHYFHDKVFPAMEALRAPVDKLEMLVDKEVWPMPSYGDLMFEV